MAVVLDSLKDVKKYLDGMGADVEFVHLPENEQKIVSLENVRNVLFQALLLDNVTVENGLFHAQMCTVMLLK